VCASSWRIAMGIFVAISEMMALEDEKPAGFVASGLQ
jgi:hypothetical protein